jgi:type II secretory pathway component PulK
MRRSNKGSALLIAVITSLVVAALVAAYLVILHARQRDVQATQAGTKAHAIADAGANNFVSGLNSGAFLPPDVGALPMGNPA